MLPVATAIQHGARFKVTASCCDLPQRQYFEGLFNENGGVFYYDKNPHLPWNYEKAMLSWKSSEGARGKREEGDRRSGLSVSAMDHVFRFAFVGVLIILERRNK